MMLSATPTGSECGVLNGQVRSRRQWPLWARGGARLAVPLMAQIDSPAVHLHYDLDDKRLVVAKTFGADLDQQHGWHAADHVMVATEGAGVDVAIEAVVGDVRYPPGSSSPPADTSPT